MAIVGRSKIDHPSLGTVGGSTLHAQIENIYENIGNHLAGRFFPYSGVANSAVTVIEHNFGAPFSDYTVLVYTGSYPNLTRVSNPRKSGWTIAATSGSEKTKISVTAPSVGGPHTFAVFISQVPLSEYLPLTGGHISVNSSTDAVKITQAGTGNAFVVEDVASDTSPFVIDADGRVIVGHTTAQPMLSGVTPNLQVLGIEQNASLLLGRYSTNGLPSEISINKYRGTIASPTAVISGDQLGKIQFRGYDGTNPIRGATIDVLVDDTPGTNDMPGRLVFSTTPSGSETSVERMRIDNQGRVAIGTTALGGGSGAFRVSLTATGSTSSAAALFSMTSGVDSTASTTGLEVNFTTPSNGGTPYTASTLRYFRANQATFSVDSTVTNQYGFEAPSSLIGAVNNYGFFGGIAAQSVTAGSFVSGQSYKITSLGTTDFTLIGATENRLGLTFTASGVGTGTGTAQAVNRWNFFASGSAENRFQGNTVIDVSTGLDALRVTQRGAGNALVVEDSTNPDSSPFVIDANGNFTIGSYSRIGNVKTQILGSDFNSSAFQISRASADNASPTITLLKSRSTSLAGVDIVQANDILGAIQFQGTDGVSQRNAARIHADVDGTPASDDMPGRLVFQTAPSGSAIPLERMRITSTGSINAVTTAAAQIPLVSGVNIEDIVIQEPSLDIDFTDSAGIPSAVTFTRSSAGVYYDGKTSSKAEENLLLRSQDYSATWTVTNLTPVTGKTAPDTTSTATEFTSSAANAVLTQSVTALALDYTFSVWIRRVTGTGNVDITAHSGGTWVTQAISGTWARYSVTQTLTAGARTPGIRVVTSGDAIEVWGAQLEQRSSLTAYLPTTTSQITNYVPTLLSAGTDVMRLDHDPVTREPKGILIEESRQNLCLRSEDFGTTWTNTNSSEQINALIAPDGQLTADKLVEDTANGVHEFNQTITLVTSTTYSLSVFAKAAERTRFRIAGRTFASWSTFPDAIFDLSAGTVVSGTGTITAVGNGWYRCSVIGTTSATNAGMNIGLVESGTTSSYTGDGYSGVYLWGAQLEAGAFPSSYIPTVASAVTRGADTATMTGTNFSDWFNPGEGTLYAEATPQSVNVSNGHLVFEINDGTTNNRHALFKANTGNASYFVSVFNGTQASTNSGAWSGFGKLAGSYALDNFASSLNGSNPATDTAGILPIVTQATIGRRADAQTYINGHIRRIIYWPERLSNDVIRTITALS